MDHRDSFGTTLFGVHGTPTRWQLAAMTRAKQAVYAGLRQAAPRLASGRPGVLVDEQLGQAVIDQALGDRDGPTPVVLAVPVEASGHPWFALEWGDTWLEHVRRLRPDYAKVLVRDNPAFDAGHRSTQLDRLAAVSAGLHDAGVPLLYELLVPATDAQLAGVGNDADRYDHDVRPELVAQVIRDNQERGIEPALWKVEGLETVEAAQLVADQGRAGGRDADMIVLGRDAPAERLDHWLEVASQVKRFVGFAIGRSIWEDVLREDLPAEETADRVAERYLGFTGHWRPAAP